MKRIIAILISVLMLMTTSVFANGNIPEELMKTPENFTAAYSISMSIDDNSDIRNLIEEMAIEDNTMSSVMGVDFLNLIASLFEYDSTVNVQADVSPDYKKIKLSLTNSNVLSSVVSSNLNYTIKSKAGLWADIDLTNEAAPKIDVIFLSPTSDKYRYFNAGKYITQEDLASIIPMFDTEEFQKTKDEISQLLFSFSKIEKTKTGYKLSMDNDGFAMFTGAIAAYTANEEDFDAETFSMFKNMKFLGKDGIKAVYTLKNGQISHAEVKTDFSMNLSAMVKAMGEEWPYKAEGIINIKLSEKVDYTKIGTTVVKFPTLNVGNSISLNKIIEENMKPDDSYDDYVIEYPYSYVGLDNDILPMVNGEYYVPLRAVLEDGYDDTVSIDYQNGVITATSENFPEFKTLRMTIGDDKVFLDESESVCATVMLIDGVTYVSTRLFEDVFGWEICEITHDILNNYFSIGFWTSE